MNDIIYITGHKNPDTDSICSAISYSNLKNRIGKILTKPIRLGTVSKETQFALTYFNVDLPELIEKAPDKMKLILVDHNEKSQSINGLENTELLEIIDHHRIADIQTSNPIYFRNEPVGCTATIITNMFIENGLEPAKEVAGLLCSAIISDTLLFKSPTSTQADRDAVEKLAAIAGIDPEKYAKEMFKAGSSLLGKTADELFNQDFKEFHLGDLKLGVSQISTMDTEGLKPIKPEIMSLMNNKAAKEKYHLLVLMLTDILDGGSELIVIGERKDLAEKAFNITLVDDSVYVPGILSRKKQVIPPLTAASGI